MMFCHTGHRAWFTALVCLASGCGSDLPTRAVSGTVTLDGIPVERGRVDLFPVDGTRGGESGADIEQGEYYVPAERGPRTGGVYRVEITSMVKSGRTFPNPINPQGKPGEFYANNIPAIYNSSSKLKITIDDKAEN